MAGTYLYGVKVTIRYFYTDALAAAWMSEHHNMKIQSTEFSKLDDKHQGSEIVYWTSECAIEGPYYIHADSIDILDLCVGDLISINNGESATLIASEEMLAQVQAMKHQFVCAPIIIQRNGKAFHWPESELLVEFKPKEASVWETKLDAERITVPEGCTKFRVIGEITKADGSKLCVDQILTPEEYYAIRDEWGKSLCK